MSLDSDGVPVRQNSYNQTAFRILKILTWLATSPLRYEDINEKLVQDHALGRPISQDTLWFYLNTLKSIQCQISRPTPSNQFRYHLEDHPFFPVLSSSDRQVLQDVFGILDEAGSVAEVMTFFELLLQLCQTSAGQTDERVFRACLDSLRLSDIRPYRHWIDAALSAVSQNQLLEILYREGKEEDGPASPLLVLPQRIFYNRGLFYILGYTLIHDESSMLRLDRIVHLRSVVDPVSHNVLLAKMEQYQMISVRFLGCDAESLPTLSDNTKINQDPLEATAVIATFKTDNIFLLKQKLLSCGLPFQILYPATLRQELEEHLQRMLAGLDSAVEEVPL